MIITLVKADFSSKNIGTLGSFAVLTNILNATYDGPTSVATGEAFTATITMHDGYTVSTDNLVISMGGAILTDAYSISDNVITINIAAVTGIIVINMIGIVDGGTDDTTIYLKNVAEAIYQRQSFDTTDATWSTMVANTNYNTFMYIPVAGNSTIRIPYCRRFVQYDSAKTPLSNCSLKNDVNNYTITLDASTAYISGTCNIADISVDEAYIEYISEDIVEDGYEEITMIEQLNTYAINKTTGVLTEGASAKSYVRTYAVEDTWDLYATGYAPNSTGTWTSIGYFDASDNSLGTEQTDGSSANFIRWQCTVPSGTVKVAVHTSTASADRAAAKLEKKTS